MSHMYAERLACRLVNITGMFPYDPWGYMIESHFEVVMGRKYPNIDWRDILRSIREYEN